MTKFLAYDRRNDVWRIRDANRSLIGFAPHLKDLAVSCFDELKRTDDLATEKAIVDRYLILKRTMPKRANKIVAVERLELRDAYDAIARLPLLMDQLITERKRLETVERQTVAQTRVYRQTLDFLGQVLVKIGGDDLIQAMSSTK